MPSVWCTTAAFTEAEYSGVEQCRLSSAPHPARLMMNGPLSAALPYCALRATAVLVGCSSGASTTRLTWDGSAAAAATCRVWVWPRNTGSVPLLAATPSRAESIGASRCHGPQAPLSSFPRTCMSVGVAVFQVIAAMLNVVPRVSSRTTVPAVWACGTCTGPAGGAGTTAGTTATLDSGSCSTVVGCAAAEGVVEGTGAADASGATPVRAMAAPTTKVGTR